MPIRQPYDNIRPILLFKYIAIIDNTRPDTKHIVDNSEDFLTFFSTKLPPKAADIPKKKIANEKQISIEATLQPIDVAISSFNNDQQYTLPIQECINKAGIAPLNHLLFNISFPIV